MLVVLVGTSRHVTCSRVTTCRHPLIDLGAGRRVHPVPHMDVYERPCGRVRPGRADRIEATALELGPRGPTRRDAREPRRPARLPVWCAGVAVFLFRRAPAARMETSRGLPATSSTGRRKPEAHTNRSPRTWTPTATPSSPSTSRGSNALPRTSHRRPNCHVVDVGEPSERETRRLYDDADETLRVITNSFAYLDNVERALAAALDRGVDVSMLMSPGLVDTAES